MIYVDKMTACLRSKHWPYSRSCHLFSDSIEELHNFAGMIGLHISWFQDRKYFPHYDLTEPMRNLSLMRGAKAVSPDFVVDQIRKARYDRLLSG